jgi:hypothetical protein
MMTDATISSFEFTQRLAAFPPPAVVDVRGEPAFDADSSVFRAP